MNKLLAALIVAFCTISAANAQTEAQRLKAYADRIQPPPTRVVDHFEQHEVCPAVRRPMSGRDVWEGNVQFDFPPCQVIMVPVYR